MRTPGHDEDLIIGFLHSEGIIHLRSHIDQIKRIEKNVCEAILARDYHYDFSHLQNRMIMSSSCGICGKSNLEAVSFTSKKIPWRSRIVVPGEVISSLSRKMTDAQALFKETGGVHAAALFLKDGELLDIAEDVGRHNALDKLIGSNLRIDWKDKIVMVSGRISFEICQKAAMVGAPVLAAIGPASSMAVEVAEEEGITLVGFVKENGFNIYSCPERIA